MPIKFAIYFKHHPLQHRPLYLLQPVFSGSRDHTTNSSTLHCCVSRPSAPLLYSEAHPLEPKFHPRGVNVEGGWWVDHLFLWIRRWYQVCWCCQLRLWPSFGYRFWLMVKLPQKEGCRLEGVFGCVWVGGLDLREQKRTMLGYCSLLVKNRWRLE